MNGPAVGLNNVTEQDQGQLPVTSILHSAQRRLGWKSSGKASGQDLKENEFVTWEKKPGKHTEGKEICVDEWICLSGTHCVCGRV